MKKMLAVFAAMMMAAPVFAQVKWESLTFQQALDKAKQENKLVFLDCYTSWCGPCKWMLKEVFPKKESGDYFNNKFINIKMDMEKGEGPELLKKYMVNGFPTFLVLDSQGNEVGKHCGSAGTPADFIKIIEGISDVEKAPVRLLEKYQKSRSVDDALAYLFRVERAEMTNRIVEFFEENYNRLPRWSKSYTPMWIYLKQAISIKHPAILDDLLANKDEFCRYLGKGEVDHTLYEALQKDLKAYLGGGIELSVEEAQKLVSVFHSVSLGNYYDDLLCQLTLAHAAKDGAALEKILKQTYQIFSKVPAENFEYLFCRLFEMEEISDEAKIAFFKDFREYVDNRISRMEGFFPQYTQAPAVAK